MLEDWDGIALAIDYQKNGNPLGLPQFIECLVEEGESIDTQMF